MRTRSIAAAAIVIAAALTASGCGMPTQSAADRADTAGADFRRDYRGDFGTFRYPGPPLTGGGN